MKDTNTIKEEWNEIIAAKLKGGLTLEDLKYEYPSGIIMEPNVMRSDIMEYTHTIDISKPWINMAVIKNGSSGDKNKLALQALQQGANGLSIEISKEDSVFEILKDILTEYLDVRMDCSQLTSSEIVIQQSSISEVDFPNIRWVSNETGCDQLYIDKNERVQSIKTLLSNLNPLKRTDVIVSLSKSLLFEIASLRAIRALLDDSGHKAFDIIAQYEVEGSNELGDYDLIEKTYKVMSGILGGANAILTPYTGDEDSRLTLNIHNILDLESGMKNVLDPLGGAYYIEKLTGEIIRQVKS